MSTPPAKAQQHDPSAPAATASMELSAAQQLALKYVELARSEILARIESVHKTLLAYVGAIAAVASFFYPKFSDALHGRAPASGAAADAEALTSVIVLLSVAALWGVVHNERMIAALAEYQRELAGPTGPLKGPPPIWENSWALEEADGGLSATLTVVTQLGLVLSPVVALLIVVGWRNVAGRSHVLLDIGLLVDILLASYVIGMRVTHIRGRRQSKRKRTQLH